MLFSENELKFNKELLDIMGTALSDIYSAGGTVKIKKGNFFAEYLKPEEIMKDMRNIRTTIHFQEYGARRKWQ